MDDGLKRILDSMRGYGRDISVYDESFLKMTIEKRLNMTGAGDADGYCLLLKESRTEAGAFCDALRITYSCFFREPLSFALIERLLPALIESKAEGSEIRVWSAGCAGGQEAYSIAILLHENIAAAGRRVRYRIFATDISGEALRIAQEGAYSLAAVKDVRMGQAQKYFIRSGDVYRAAPLLKENICFSEYDLLDRGSAHPPESIYGGFDIVFCRNVMLYYRASLRNFMMEKLARSLADGGILVAGEAERSFAARTAGLDELFPSAAVFKKQKTANRNQD